MPHSTKLYTQKYTDTNPIVGKEDGKEKNKNSGTVNMSNSNKHSLMVEQLSSSQTN